MIYFKLIFWFPTTNGVDNYFGDTLCCLISWTVPKFVILKYFYCFHLHVYFSARSVLIFLFFCLFVFFVEIVEVPEPQPEVLPPSDGQSSSSSNSDGKSRLDLISVDIRLIRVEVRFNVSRYQINASRGYILKPGLKFLNTKKK